MSAGAVIPKAPEAALVRTSGLRHLALRVRDLSGVRAFYSEVFGMRTVWEPDADNVYLSSGRDNLALHRVDDLPAAGGAQALDHLGFFVADADEVQRAEHSLRARGVPIVHPTRHHRDGSWSVYCSDPDGNTVQILYDPNTNP